MMSIVQMKEVIKKVYPGDKWTKRVSKMSDGQVVAIYYKFLKEGKLC